MVNEFLVHTGSIIREYLDANHISQKDFALRTGVSEKHISNLLNGKSRLTEDMALKLEKLIPSVPASYWLNYEIKYREHLARQAEENKYPHEQLQVFAKRFKFSEVFKGLGLTLAEQAVEMLKLLRISDFSCFENTYSEFRLDFMEDGGELESIAIWIRLCEEEVFIQNQALDDVAYLKKELLDHLVDFKMIALNSNLDYALTSCRKLCNRLGIYLVVHEAITNSKVRGALTTIDNHPAIFLSLRYQTADYIWFAFMHEIGHLLLHYDPRGMSISYDEKADGSKKEIEASNFAQQFFINQCAYDDFVSQCYFNETSIRQFANKQEILPAIVVARLQHDGIIGYDKFAYLKK